MLHLVTAANRHLYEAEIAALHRVRKQVFVDQLGWSLAVTGDAEHDEYDDARAMHLIGFDATGAVTMGTRIRPADDRSMLADHFADWLPPGAPPIADGATWEVSRGFCRERGLKRRARLRRAACMTAPIEVALAHGAARFVGITDVGLLPLYAANGWRIEQLGEARDYGEGTGIAYAQPLSRALLDGIREGFGLPAPCHVHLTALEPGETVHDAARRMTAGDPRALALDPSPPDPEEEPSRRLARRYEAAREIG